MTFGMFMNLLVNLLATVLFLAQVALVVYIVYLIIRLLKAAVHKLENQQ